MNLERSGTDCSDIRLKEDLLFLSPDERSPLRDQFDCARTKIAHMWGFTNLTDEHLRSGVDD
jgi:hypothetical protein